MTRRRRIMYASLSVGTLSLVAIFLSTRLYIVYHRRATEYAFWSGAFTVDWSTNALEPYWRWGQHGGSMLWWPVWLLASPVGFLWIPLWPIPVAAFGLATRAWSLERRARRSGAVCPCGYDLHGNTTGVCPECGKSVGA